jgi:two-component system sensor histidine kinase ComP
MVEDDGIGFDQKVFKSKLKGIGLSDIQNRVKSMKGHFSLESSPGEGVLATVEVPLDGER